MIKNVKTFNKIETTVVLNEPTMNHENAQDSVISLDGMNSTDSVNSLDSWTLSAHLTVIPFLTHPHSKEIFEQLR